MTPRTKGIIAMALASVLLVGAVAYVFCFIDEENAISYEEVDSIPGFEISHLEGTAGTVVLYKNSLGENTVRFTDMNSDSVYEVTGNLNGNIAIDSDGSFELIFNGASVRSNQLTPISMISGQGLIVSASDGTENNISDFRDSISSVAGAIHSSSDLLLDGDGSLRVQSTHNTALESVGDITLSIAMMTVDSEKDSVICQGFEMNRGEISLTSHRAGGIVASGTVTVNTDYGSATLSIRSPETAMDAQGDIDIEGDPKIYISTADMAPRSDDSTIYIGYATKDYTFSLQVMDKDGNVTWINPSGDPTLVFHAKSRCYLYTFSIPVGCHEIVIYAYDQDQTQGQGDDYKCRSDRIQTGFDRNSFLVTQIVTGMKLMYRLADFAGPEQPDFDKLPTMGIKSEKDVNIRGGNITIDSNGGSIHARDDLSIYNAQITAFSRDNALSAYRVEISGGDIALFSTGNMASAIRTDAGYTYTGGRVLAVCVSSSVSIEEMTKCDGYGDIATDMQFEQLFPGTYLRVTVGTDDQVEMCIPDNGTGAPPIPKDGQSDIGPYLGMNSEQPFGPAMGPGERPGEGDMPYSTMLVTYIGSSEATITNTDDHDHGLDDNGVWWS